MELEDKEHLNKLKEAVNDAPLSAGVYLWLDKGGKVIYVGKAKHLKNRLKSYFIDKAPKEPHQQAYYLKTRQLMASAYSVETITVDSEYEALVLENNLIKKHRPKYNISLKDDKSYPYVRITNEDFPALFSTRNLIKDGSEYFGPYPLGHLEAYMQVINKTFKLRKCKAIPLRTKSYNCLYYHIHQCLGPCNAKISQEDYAAEIDKIKALLSGKTAGFIKELKQDMAKAAGLLNYERAALLRDAITAIENTLQKQSVEELDNTNNSDYLGFAGSEGLYCFVVLHVRDGKLLHKELFKAHSLSEPYHALNEFLVRYYLQDRAERANLVIVEKLPHNLDYSRFFQEEGGKKIRVNEPLNERDVKLLRMAFDNAMYDLMRETNKKDALEGLKQALQLNSLPKVIEGIDIAQLNGHYTVASLVNFKNGLPNKKNYRRFRIKSLAAGEINDYQSISEVVARHFTKLLNGGESLPDLLLIDGGKGQLGAAYDVLKSLGLEEELSLASLAKREEEVFIVGQSAPIILAKGSAELRLLQAVRDETHRFATTYNQKLRAGTLKLNTLEGVQGIGKQKAKQLLTEFGSLETISKQDGSALAKVAKISNDKALEVIKHLEEALKDN
ncbi:MAG: excinuclease ABC subunit UvrC [Spirochaetaceae bacterium]|nr:excinuclease ABC subunit UvrC [Spirochaetaceae bacterium]